MTKERIIQALRIIEKNPSAPNLNLIYYMDLKDIDAEGNAIPVHGEAGLRYRLGYIVGHLEGADYIAINNKYQDRRLIRSEIYLTKKGKALVAK
jgi:hypothetical protein